MFCRRYFSENVCLDIVDKSLGKFEVANIIPFGQNSGTKEFLEVDRIGNPENACLEIGDHVRSFEEANFMLSNQNLGMKELLEEVDKDGNSQETNFVSFVGQTFLSRKKHLPFTRDMHINMDSQFGKAFY